MKAMEFAHQPHPLPSLSFVFMGTLCLKILVEIGKRGLGTGFARMT